MNLGPRLTPQRPRDHGQAFAYDPFRDRVWMFGGDNKLLADTWEWDGATWNRRYPERSPPAC